MQIAWKVGRSGNYAAIQRAVKRARFMALMPYVGD
jgi:ribosomal protein S18